MIGKKDKGTIKGCVNDEGIGQKCKERELESEEGRGTQREAGLLKLMRY